MTLEEQRETPAGIPFVPNEVASAIIADACREDKNLAARLGADVGKTVSESSDGAVSLPEGVRVFTVQNTPGLVHVPLPDHRELDAAVHDAARQLTDEEVKMISGGEFFGTVIFAIGGAITAIGTTLGVGGFAAFVVGAAVIVGVTAVVAGGIAGAGVAIAKSAGAFDSRRMGSSRGEVSLSKTAAVSRQFLNSAAAAARAKMSPTR